MSARTPKVTARNGHISSRAAVAAGKPAASPSKPPLIKLANGIVLRVKPVSQALMRDAISAVPVPQPPVTHDDARDEDLPNEAHPDYIAAMKQYVIDVNQASGKAAMLMGTTVESVPEGLSGPWEEDWVDWVRLTSVVPDLGNRALRYLSWMTHYALTTTEDRSIVIFAPLIASSLGEQEVESAVDSFRRDKKWGVYTQRAAAGADPDGDLVPDRVAGDRVRDGGARSRNLRRGNVADVASPSAT